MFSFVEEFEGLDFRGALKVLADRAGVTLDDKRRSDDTEREGLFGALETAAVFFEKELKKSDDAKTYLKSRGLIGETAYRFRIGYAPSDWRMLYNELVAKGYKPAVAQQAGLLIASEKGYYDRFRDRVMFPIGDSSGRIIGFSGRILHQNEDRAQAKYVNTPDTPLFDKSHVLYGFDKAKTSIRKEGICVVVEGQMDLVMSHQAGVSNVVAASGTAFSEHHAKLIKRLAETVIFAFDADDAGTSASLRAIHLALAEGLEVKMVTLPPDEDPADVVKRDPAAWKQAVAGACHVVDFFLTALGRKGYDERKFRLEASGTILPFIANVPNSVERAHFVSQLAKALSVSEEPLWEELKKVIARQERAPATRQDTFEETVSHIADRSSKILDRIAGTLLWQERLKDAAINTRDIRSQLMLIAENRANALLSAPESDRAKELIFEAEVYYQGSEHVAQDMRELLVELEQEILKQEFTEAMDALRKAEIEGNETHIALLLKKCQEISKKLGGITKT
jgi:DNA primase